MSNSFLEKYDPTYQGAIEQPSVAHTGVPLSPEGQEVLGNIQKDNHQLELNRLYNKNPDVVMGETLLPEDLVDGIAASAYTFRAQLGATTLDRIGQSIEDVEQLYPDIREDDFFTRFQKSLGEGLLKTTRNIERREREQEEDLEYMKGRGFFTGFGEKLAQNIEAPFQDINDVISFSTAIPDAILDAGLTSKGAIRPKRFKDAAVRLMRKNELELAEAGMLRKPEHASLTYQAGQGGFSVLATLGSLLATKSPKVAAGVMGSMVNVSSYYEARQQGLSLEEANDHAMNVTLSSAAIEFLGGKFFLSAMGKSSAAKRFALRVMGQGLEEGSQEGVESYFANRHGIREEEFSEVLMNMLKAATIGMIISKPMVGFSTFIEQKAIDADAKPELIKDIVTKFVEQERDIADFTHEFLLKETTDMNISRRARRDVFNITKDLLEKREQLIEESGSAKAAETQELLTAFKDLQDEAAKLRANLEQRDQSRVNAALEGIKRQQEALRLEIDSKLREEFDDLQMQIMRDIEEMKREGSDKITPDVLEAYNALRQSVSDKKKIKKSQTLTQFVRKEGGIKDDRGDVKRIGFERNDKIYRPKAGKSVDDMGLLATEAGFFQERPTIDEFLQALEGDYRGYNPSYRGGDIDREVERGQLSELIGYLEKYISDAGVTGNIKEQVEKAKKMLKNLEKKKDRLGKKQEEIEGVYAELMRGERKPDLIDEGKSSYKGKIKAYHKGVGLKDNTFLPAKDVDVSLRYDNMGVWGEGTYLDETGSWVSGDMLSTTKEALLYEVQANFENAFVLTPESYLEFMALFDYKNNNFPLSDVASILKGKGYDGVIVRGFNNLEIKIINDLRSKGMLEPDPESVGGYLAKRGSFPVYEAFKDAEAQKLVEEGKEWNKEAIGSPINLYDFVEAYIYERLGKGNEESARLSNILLQDQVVSFTPEKSLTVLRVVPKVKNVTAFGAPPTILADKLKTFTQGIRKGRILQKAETKDVQKEYQRIIKESGLSDKVQKRLLFGTKEVQTVDQLVRRIESLIPEIKAIFVAETNAKIAKDIKSVLNPKKLKPTRKGNAKQGKFFPEITEILLNISDVAQMTPKKAEAYVVEAEKARANGEVVLSSEDSIKLKIASIIANKDLDVEENANFVTDLKKIIAGEKAALKSEVLRRTEELRELKNRAVRALKNRQPDRDVNVVDYTKKVEKLRAARKNVTGAFSGWLNGWYDWVDRQFGATDKGLVEMLRVGEEIRKERMVTIQGLSMINKAYQEAYNLKDYAEAKKKLLNDSAFNKKDVLVNAIFTVPDGKKNFKDQRVTLTVAQARDLYMKSKDATVLPVLEEQYGKDTLESIFKLLSEQDKKFADSLLKIYKQLGEQVNEVYKDVYFADLGLIENYSPLRRELDDGKIEEAGGEFLGESIHKETVLRSSLKQRANNKYRIAVQSDVDVFAKYLGQMSHFIAFAKKAQQLEAVFGGTRSELERLLKDRSGSVSIRFLKAYKDAIIRGGAPVSRDVLESGVNYFNRNFAASVLAGKIAMMPKQITSFIAYSENVPVADFAEGVADFVVNYKEAIRVLGDTPLMKTRGASPELDIANMGQQVQSKILNKKNAITQALLKPIQWGDRGAIYAGGWAYYKYQRKQGLSHEQAIKKFESFTDGTQQSAAVDQLTALQLSSPFGRVFTMFLTAPASYLRAQMRALTDYNRGDITGFQLGKKMALYQVALPVLFQIVAAPFSDEDELVGAAIKGNISGLFIVGGMASKLYDNAVLDKNYPTSQDPHFLSWLEDVYKGFGAFLKEDADGEDIMKGVLELASAAGKVTGVPVDAIQGVVEGGAGLVEEFDERDPDTEDIIKDSLRILGWSESSLK